MPGIITSRTARSGCCGLAGVDRGGAVADGDDVVPECRQLELDELTDVHVVVGDHDPRHELPLPAEIVSAPA